jgi:hypothetical protein
MGRSLVSTSWRVFENSQPYVLSFCIHSLLTSCSPYENTPAKLDQAIVGPQFPNLFVRIVALNGASCGLRYYSFAHI